MTTSQRYSGRNSAQENVFSENDTITLGNGAGDTVNVSLAEVPFLAAATGTISLGNGAGDTVTAGGFVVAGANDKITLGDGAGDVVTAAMEGATITLGNGAGDVVKFGLGFPALLSIQQSHLAMATMTLSTSHLHRHQRHQRLYNQPRQRQQ